MVKVSKKNTSHLMHFCFSEAVIRRCFVKKVFLNFSWKFTGKHTTGLFLWTDSDTGFHCELKIKMFRTAFSQNTLDTSRILLLVLINPYANVPFLQPPENLRKLEVFWRFQGGIEIEYWFKIDSSSFFITDFEHAFFL